MPRSALRILLAVLAAICIAPFAASVKAEGPAQPQGQSQSQNVQQNQSGSGTQIAVQIQNTYNCYNCVFVGQAGSLANGYKPAAPAGASRPATSTAPNYRAPSAYSQNFYGSTYNAYANRYPSYTPYAYPSYGANYGYSSYNQRSYGYPSYNTYNRMWR